MMTALIVAVAVAGTGLIAWVSADFADAYRHPAEHMHRDRAPEVQPDAEIICGECGAGVTATAPTLSEAYRMVAWWLAEHAGRCEGVRG